MTLKRLTFLFAFSILILGGCGNDTLGEASSYDNASEEFVESITTFFNEFEESISNDYETIFLASEYENEVLAPKTDGEIEIYERLEQYVSDREKFAQSLLDSEGDFSISTAELEEIAEESMSSRRELVQAFKKYGIRP